MKPNDLLLGIVKAQLIVAKNSLATANVALLTVERILGAEVPEPAESQEEPEPEEPPSRPAPPTPQDEEEDAPGLLTPEKCEHPRQNRVRTAVMGKPKRWLCNLCGHEADE